MNSIHGHEVMHMMVQSGKQYTRESLRNEIHSVFGAEARFHTCSAYEMTADELIEFLSEKGKFLSRGEEFTTHAEKICNH